MWVWLWRQLLKDNGGVFECQSDDVGTLASAVMSHPNAIEFIWKYQDMMFIDGTANTNKYQLDMLIYSVMDCLGITLPVSFCFTNSEKSKDLEKKEKLSGLRGDILSSVAFTD